MKPDERELLILLARTAGFPRDIGAAIGMPPRRISYLCEKWAKRGWYSYGVNVDLGWLEPAGLAKAKELEPDD